MQEFDFTRAATLDDLLRLLAETGGRVIAGGTDVLVQAERGAFPASALVDAGRVRELRFIRQEGETIRIGALTTYADLLASPLLGEAAPALVAAARTVGAPQTRARGTLGGNIANASPAGDTLPPLLALDAEVRLVKLSGGRDLPLAAVLCGPRQTCLEPGEIIHSVSFRRPPQPCGAAFLKLGNRRGMAISVVNVAALLVFGANGRITAAHVALGAVAPTPLRSPHAEAALRGQAPAAEVLVAASQAVLHDIAPISDVRGSADYRRVAAVRLTERALRLAVQGAGREVSA
jgi:CO/xanthine dehydrogenase FAD-binding subunit